MDYYFNEGSDSRRYSRSSDTYASSATTRPGIKLITLFTLKTLTQVTGFLGCTMLS